MGLIIDRKGQTEDIFGDLLLAFLLSIVGIIFLILASGYLSGGIDHGMEDIYSLDVKNDLLIFLNTGLGNIDLGNEGLGRLSELGLNRDSKVIDFLYIMALLYKGNFQDDFRDISWKIMNSRRFITQDYLSSGKFFDLTPRYRLFYRLYKGDKTFSIRIMNQPTRNTPYSSNAEPTINVYVLNSKKDALEDDTIFKKDCLEGEYSDNPYFYKTFGRGVIKSENYDGQVEVIIESCGLGLRERNE